MVEDGEPLSEDDERILGLESDSITGHTLKLMILEPGGEPVNLEQLRKGVADRLAYLPRATEQVVQGTDGPRWLRDDAFDVDAHVRRRASTVPVTPDGLWRTVGDLMSEHLDRQRPLWRFDVIGPLTDGREAIAARIHHAMADGIAGVRFLDAVLFDPREDPPAQSGAAGVHTTVAPSFLTEVRRLPEALLRELARPSGRSPLDRPVGVARELAFTTLPMAELRRIGASRPNHATLNDVLLATVAGGLRGWLSTGGGLRRLRAQVPVSLHHRDEGTADLGNRDSFINVDLPLAESDPVVRLDLIRAQTAKRKQLDDAEELFDLFHALGRIPRVGATLQRLAGSAREFGVAISNVPGPAESVNVAGRRVLQLFSSSEPAAHHALRISAISCSGDIGIGLCTDPRALPDVAGLADCIEGSYAELRAAALS